MIIDALDNYARYLHLHPTFGEAFEFLRTTNLADAAAGRRELSGLQLAVSIDHVSGVGRDHARLEAHRRYIDIQVAFQGVDEIGWRPLAECHSIAEPYDPVRDIGFWSDPPDSWIMLPPGRFAIFFPEDAHAPLAGTGAVRKAVMKVAVRV